MKLTQEIIALFMIFAYVFVGDYYFFEFPVFLLIWFFIIFYRIVMMLRFSQREIILQLVSVIIISPLLFRGAYYGNRYEFSLVYAILFINVFPLFLYIFNNIKYQKHFLTINFIFLILTIAMYVTNINSIVFGPNIFYRIVGFSYMSYFVISIIHKNFNIKYILLSYLSTLTTALATQSRGALLLSIIFMTMTTGFILRKSKYMYILLFIIISILYILFININAIILLFGRSAYLDLDNASEAARIDFVYYVLDYYENLSFKEFAFGLGYPNRYFYIDGEYPHNLFLELFISFGSLYFIIFISIILVCLIRFKKSQWLLIAIFLPMYFGSQLSGYFGDHSYLLLLPLAVLLLFNRYSYDIKM